MDNQLKALISLCEEEKVQLQKLIDESVLEAEYLMAHHHSEALEQLNRRLYILKNLDDKLYGDKQFIKDTIGGLERIMQGESSANMKEYLEEEIQEAKDKLANLNQIPRQPTPEYSTLLDETLTKLLENKIKKLKLILRKNDNLLLSFTYTNKILKVTLPYVNQHIRKWILNGENIDSLNKLGFKLTENETKLILIINGNKTEILNTLKVILFKIVFEIFYYKEFDNESYIEFKEKASH